MSTVLFNMELQEIIRGTEPNRDERVAIMAWKMGFQVNQKEGKFIMIRKQSQKEVKKLELDIQYGKMKYKELRNLCVWGQELLIIVAN